MKFDAITIAWDFKEEPTKEMIRAVEFLKNASDPHMYPHPHFEGTDTYGWIVSKRALTKKEINAYVELELKELQ